MLPTIEREPRRSRYSSATLYPAVGRVDLRRLRPRDPTVPDASSSATRVSPRSTLTSTCFFNFQSFVKLDRAHPRGGAVMVAALTRLGGAMMVASAIRGSRRGRAAGAL